MTPTVLTLPGWHGSGPLHWQSHWEARWGDRRVEQADWELPLRGDWICQLEQAVLEAPADALLLVAAHSLGCHLLAGWAAVSRHASRVRGALLVAPPDLERADLPPALHSWRGHALQPLPFAAQLISSDNDPYCTPAAARQLAGAWGCRHHTIGAAGHINADSGLGDWSRGRAWLLACAEPIPST